MVKFSKKSLNFAAGKVGIILFSEKIGQNSLKTDYCLSSDEVERV